MVYADTLTSGARASPGRVDGTQRLPSKEDSVEVSGSKRNLPAEKADKHDLTTDDWSQHPWLAKVTVHTPDKRGWKWHLTSGAFLPKTHNLSLIVRKKQQTDSSRHLTRHLASTQNWEGHQKEAKSGVPAVARGLRTRHGVPEDAGWIPGLGQRVKDLALSQAVA